MMNIDEAIKQVKKQTNKECLRMSDTIDDKVMEDTLRELQESPAALLKFHHQCMAIALVGMEIKSARETMFAATQLTTAYVTAAQMKKEFK